jgi:hypothetical protein
MAVRLTRHAARHVQLDQIDPAWIERAIQQPEHSDHDPRDATVQRVWRRIPERGGRVLRVVFRYQGSDVIVVTVFFDRGATRWL